MDVYLEYGPPAFVTLAVANGYKAPKTKPKIEETATPTTDDEKYANLEQLAAQFAGQGGMLG